MTCVPDPIESDFEPLILIYLLTAQWTCGLYHAALYTAGTDYVTAFRTFI